MARDEPGRPLPAHQRQFRVRAALLAGGLSALLGAGGSLLLAPASASAGPAGATRLGSTTARQFAATLARGADASPSPGSEGDPPPTESPGPDPTATDTTPPAPPDPPSPSESTTTQAPTPIDPAPTTAGPPPPPPPAGSPTPPPAPPPPPPGTTPGHPGPQEPGAPRRGVYVTTSDITLPESYWSARSTVADLRVTIANTGEVSELVQLSYTLPAGLTDAGTPGCRTADGGGRCTAWTVAAGARFSTHLRLRVDGDAWRRMPLSGSVQVSASRPNAPAVLDNQGFAVLFPAGPPVPGISLSASDVSFDITGQATTLDVRLGNTGHTDAGGTVEVVLPAGVTVPTPPPGCVALAPDRTRCDLGRLAAGQVGTARLPVAATPEAQRNAPLAGAASGTLTPRAGKPKTIHLSFRIVAVAALATPAALTDPMATGSQGALPGLAGAAHDTGLSRVQKTAIALIGASLLLVVLALALATGSLRRIGRPKPAEGTGGPPGP
ncbi:hypothetical protein ACFFWC_16490 [Plantactinospora siamensis]|uniref:DUF11 domain-containing protein n=1 Tax=Plantactinospora siamensis TaxID=555372 RepID=A0ABV6NVC4_9ACTN